MSLEVLATPGHTPESISVVVSDGGSPEPWGDAWRAAGFPTETAAGTTA